MIRLCRQPAKGWTGCKLETQCSLATEWRRQGTKRFLVPLNAGWALAANGSMGRQEREYFPPR
jgi:hypothetical protein